MSSTPAARLAQLKVKYAASWEIERDPDSGRLIAVHRGTGQRVEAVSVTSLGAELLEAGR